MAQDNNGTPPPSPPKRRRSQLHTLEDVRRYMAEIIRTMKRAERLGGGIQAQNGTLLVNALSKLAYVIQQIEHNDFRDIAMQLEQEVVALRAEFAKFKAKQAAKEKT